MYILSATDMMFMPPISHVLEIVFHPPTPFDFFCFILSVWIQCQSSILSKNYLVSINVSTSLKHISKCLSVLRFSELNISHVNGFGGCSINIFVLSLNDTTWIWKTLSSSNWYASSWLIIFLLAYQESVSFPLLNGAKEHINSITHNGIRMWLRCHSLLLLTFLFTLCITQNASFEDP